MYTGKFSSNLSSVISYSIFSGTTLYYIGPLKTVIISEINKTMKCRQVVLELKFLKNVKNQQNCKIMTIRKILATNSSAMQIALTINTAVLPRRRHTGIRYRIWKFLKLLLAGL